MPEQTYTKNILEYATFGINENIDADATVEVRLRDLVFISQTLQEFVQFFHNRDHYPTIDEVHEYLGNRENNRAYHLLSVANYDVMKRMLPKMVYDLYGEGAFVSPEIPFYFEPKN